MRKPVTTRSYLTDGPIMLTPERRAARAIDMGASLVLADAFRDRDDAIRALHAAGYPVSDIVILIDDAMQWAVQAVVAAEMSEQP